LALLVAAAKIVCLFLVAGNTSFSPIFVIVGAFLVVVKEVFSIVFWVLIIRAILSWVSQGHNPIEMVMHQLTEPMLGPIRRILPPLGGLALSVLVALILLQFLQLFVRDVTGKLMPVMVQFL
jgi:YggT family protein